MIEDSIYSIGRILNYNETHSRDAIHIAIMPVEIGEPMCPGQRVVFRDGSQSVVVKAADSHGIGVIDPFLESPFKGNELVPGFRVWLLLHPCSTTNLRHEWRHPIVDGSDKPEAESWLREFAAKWNMDYTDMVHAAIAGDYALARGIDLHSKSELNGEDGKFWECIEELTGRTFSEHHRDNFSWSCSC